MRETGGSFDEPRGNITPINPPNERAFAPVFPYRGMQQHGVHVEEQPWIPRDADAQSWEGEVPFDPEITPIEPIPVIIVNESEKEIRSFRTTVHTVTKISSTRIVGGNERMGKVRIKHVNAEDTTALVYISDGRTVSSYMGFPLSPGESVEIATEDDVFAWLGDGATNDTANVAILIELYVGG